MSQGINRFKADLRELHFVLFEQFKLGELLGKDPFADWGEEEVAAIFNEVHRFGVEVLGPLNSVGDQTGCHVEDGQVITPPGFKEAWTKLYETGFKSLAISPEYGGMGAPSSVNALATELTSGPNTAFDMYPGLTIGAAELIEAFGNDIQREYFCEKMFNGTWAGTMCLSEPQAGSDVGESKTSAKKNPDGTYSIKGAKMWISGGDHDLTENIIHMVLARIEGAPKGTKGLSLFIVPKFRIKDDGALEPNDVTVASIEHKMGIKGSSTALLQFGDNDDCRGRLLGDAEHQGIKQMFRMMNYARIGVGIQGLSIAGTAYLNAVEYAKERKQGPSIKNWKDPQAPRVPIIEHPDVRRMLLDMKARVEGIRRLVIKGSMHLDRCTALGDSDEEKLAYHMGQIELITPLIKAYSSDQSFRICETAIQVHGGVGYTQDFPVEQYCRDSKIFSIYEGTNHIQALDLVGRKLGQRGGANMQALLGDIATFVGANSDHAELGDAVKTLGEASNAIAGCAMQFLAWFQQDQLELVPLSANQFLHIMSECVVGWLLLESAVIALEKLSTLDESHPDYAFYRSKKHVANYWARNVLPNVISGAEIVKTPDMSAMAISDAGFGAY